MHKKYNNSEHHSLWDFSQWEFDTPEFALPCDAGVGRMQRFSFPSGFTLFRSELRVDKTCTIEARGAEHRLAELLCTQCNLSGESIMETLDGRQYTVNADTGMLFHIPPPGLRYTLPGQQLVRHVGVTAPTLATLERLSQPLPACLQVFVDLPANETLIHPLKVNNHLRKMLAKVFTSQAHGQIHPLALEGMAISIYAEIIKAHTKQCQGDTDTGRPYDQQAFTELVDYVRNHLALPLRAEDIMHRFGISKYRLYKSFQRQHGCSFANFLRRERLQKAKTLIEEGVAVKAAAFEVGYKHTSNFTLAYRQFFGETPGQTQRRLGLC